MTATSDDLLLPGGARLLHIGPPKTGTTSVQGAFFAARDEVAKQGVHYAGLTRHPANAVLAVTRRPGFFSDDREPPEMRRWERLMREIGRARSDRVVLSSELFADATDAAIERIVSDLDPDRVQVVVTLRPLAALLPSQWQQYVRAGLRAPYEAWLEAMLRPAAKKMTPTFWQRHRHDELVSRWSRRVGAGHMTVIVVDESDRDALLRVFEQLIGLRAHTLTPPDDVENRSMTLPEIEVIRAFNVIAKGAGVGKGVLNQTMHFGAAQYMRRRTPSAEEARIRTPAWALARAAEIGEEMASSIAESGARVIGDLDQLSSTRQDERDEGQVEPVSVSPEIAAWAAMGMLRATVELHEQERQPETGAPSRQIAAIPTRRVARMLVGRVGRAVAGPLQRRQPSRSGGGRNTVS